MVIEKPFTRTTEEADRIIAIAKETGKTLTCFQNRRYDGDHKTIAHLAHQGALGTITEFENHYDMEFPTWIQGWKSKDYVAGEGMVFGLGTHSIDQVLQFFGRPASVTAFLRSLRGIGSEIDDTFTIVLQYGGKRNLLVTIKTTVVSCPLGPMGSQLKVLIRGTKGSYIKYGTDAQEADSMAGKSATEPGFGVEDESLHGVLCTIEEFDSADQKQDPVSKKYIGQYPTIRETGSATTVTL